MFGEDIGNGVEVRKAGAYYAGAVFLSLVCLFGLLKLFRKVEYQKKQGEAQEMADAETDEKQMAAAACSLDFILVTLATQQKVDFCVEINQ